MKKDIFKKIGFFLGAVALFAVILHGSHAEAAHVSAGGHDCVLCQNLKATDVPLSSASLQIQFEVSPLVFLSEVFQPILCCIVSRSRAPPSLL